jgi:hypothetical protein
LKGETWKTKAAIINSKGLKFLEELIISHVHTYREKPEWKKKNKQIAEITDYGASFVPFTLFKNQPDIYSAH